MGERRERESERKRKSGEMPLIFRNMKPWVKSNRKPWEKKGMDILKADPDEFINVKLAKSWRETDEIMIYPSCKAIEHMEKLYKYMVRGKSDKNVDKKVLETLSIVSINMEIETEFDHELSGEDVHVAISYVIFMYLGSLGADVFKQRL